MRVQESWRARYPVTRSLRGPGPAPAGHPSEGPRMTQTRTARPSTGATVPRGATVPAAAAWRPAAEVTEHSGQPIPPDADFFLAPPPELGELFSAYTSLRQGEEPRPFASRFFIGSTVGIVIIAAAYGLLYMMNNGRVRSEEWVWSALPAAIALLAVLYVTRFKATCSYVGAEGVVRYRLANSRETAPKVDGFMFRDAAELRTSQTRNYTNGIYTGTTYEFNWTNPAGQRVYRLNGTYQSAKGTPKPKDPFHFANSPELAWSNYLLARVPEQIERDGFLHFNLGREKWVRVGPGFFVFNIRGKEERVNADEIKEISLNNGDFYIAHKDAGG